MPREESLVVIDQQVPQVFPREDIETVISIVLNLHEGHDESIHRAGFPVSDHLSFTIKRDVTILRDVAELPRRATTGFHLDRDVPSCFVGSDDVVVRDISGEGGCN